MTIPEVIGALVGGSFLFTVLVDAYNSGKEIPEDSQTRGSKKQAIDNVVDQAADSSAQVPDLQLVDVPDAVSPAQNVATQAVSVPAGDAAKAQGSLPFDEPPELDIPQDIDLADFRA